MPITGALLRLDEKARVAVIEQRAHVGVALDGLGEFRGDRLAAPLLALAR